MNFKGSLNFARLDSASFLKGTKEGQLGLLGVRDIYISICIYRYLHMYTSVYKYLCVYMCIYIYIRAMALGVYGSLLSRLSPGIGALQAEEPRQKGD